LRRMPRNVLQSNWYYGLGFEGDHDARTRERTKRRCGMFGKLAEAGFDTIPCGSNYDTGKNFGALVQYCDKVVSPERLKGYLMAPWFATLPGKQGRKLLEGIDQVGAAMKARA